MCVKKCSSIARYALVITNTLNSQSNTWTACLCCHCVFDDALQLFSIIFYMEYFIDTFCARYIELSFKFDLPAIYIVHRILRSEYSSPRYSQVDRKTHTHTHFGKLFHMHSCFEQKQINMFFNANMKLNKVLLKRIVNENKWEIPFSVTRVKIKKNWLSIWRWFTLKNAFKFQVFVIIYIQFDAIHNSMTQPSKKRFRCSTYFQAL